VDVRLISASIAAYYAEVVAELARHSTNPEDRGARVSSEFRDTFLSHRAKQMTPKFRGVGEALKKFQHNLDADASKLMERIEGADHRREAVFTKSHAALADANASLDEVDTFLSDLEKTNAGPPLDDSPRSSEVAQRQREWNDR